MNENGPDIQSISTERPDYQTDHVLLLGQVTEKEEKAHPSHFLKFLLTNCTNGTFGLAQQTSRPFAKTKEPFFANTHKTVNSLKNQSI
jgi:hypothetical protein